ncbi:MAG: CvpA family protein [Gammaproteobacteria bacterium]|nr:CvpA family protein [Gammaproteobacteria bacterium]
MNQMSGMNWVDIVIIAVVGISSIFGLWRGLVKEVFSLVTWVAALIVARVYSTSLAPLFTGIFDGETTRYVAAFTLLFIITIMVGAMINHLLSRLLSVAGLKFTDRLLGGIFGIARGGIIVMMFVFVLSGLLSTNITWQQSRLIPYSVSMIEWSRIFVSDLSLLDEPVEADEIL